LFEQLRYRLVVLLHHKTESVEEPHTLIGETWARRTKGLRNQKETVTVFGVRKEEGAVVIDWVMNPPVKILTPIIIARA